MLFITKSKSIFKFSQHTNNHNMDDIHVSIGDAYRNILEKGYEPTCFTHQWEESELSIYPCQMLAALQCIWLFFISKTVRTWIHLAAEMQAGKTGVVDALIRLVLNNHRNIRITPERIFIVTGMNDKAWQRQTSERMIDVVRENVFHNGRINKLVKRLKKLAETSTFANILIIIDESHIATKEKHRPNKIYTVMKELCDPSRWKENNIHFMTISATDPSKVVAISDESMRCDARVVNLHTTEEYQSIEKLMMSGRIKDSEGLDGLHIPNSSAIEQIKETIRMRYSDTPLYHIIRPSNGKQDDVANKIMVAFPDARVIRWDSTTKDSFSSGDDSSSVDASRDINEELCIEPEQHTFIILKNMFYAAKTLDDKYVGILYDRVGGKDETNLQSLIGRACGYGKSERTVVFTSMGTVRRYIDVWKSVLHGEGLQDDLPFSPETINKGNFANVKAVNGASGSESSKLKVNVDVAVPVLSRQMKIDREEKEAIEREKEDKMTIPLVLCDVSDEYFEDIEHSTTEQKRELTRNLVISAFPGNSFAHYVKSYRGLTIGTPRTQNAIKKKILAPINASNENKKYILDVHEEDRRENVWLAMLDPYHKRVVVMAWHGAGETMMIRVKKTRN